LKWPNKAKKRRLCYIEFQILRHDVKPLFYTYLIPCGVDDARNGMALCFFPEVDREELLLRLRVPHVQVLFIVGHVRSNANSGLAKQFIYYPLSRQRLPLVKFNLLGVGVPKDVLNALLSMLLVGRCERVPKFESFVVFACCDLIRDKLVATDTASCLQNVSHLFDLGASVFISVLLSTTFHKKLYLFLIY